MQNIFFIIQFSKHFIKTTVDYWEGYADEPEEAFGVTGAIRNVHR